MENNYLLKRVKNWYLVLILGIILIIAGFWVFSTPVLSYATLSLLFAITFFVTGILEIAYAISNRKEMDNWGWSLISGIIDLLIGILLMALPLTSMMFLVFYVGFGIMFRSAVAIGHAINLKKINISGWGYLLFIGILGVLFSFILIWNPVFAGLTIVFYTGMAFIMVGIFHVILSFRLRKLKKLIS
ncbi:MAG: DUF308 domain-containing protein [Bacteroidetes bacterium]|nr:DUF308 domain-containing protein [Bacteroidota bacterium]